MFIIIEISKFNLAKTCKAKVFSTLQVTADRDLRPPCDVMRVARKRVISVVSQTRFPDNFIVDAVTIVIITQSIDMHLQEFLSPFRKILQHNFRKNKIHIYPMLVTLYMFFTLKDTFSVRCLLIIQYPSIYPSGYLHMRGLLL